MPHVTSGEFRLPTGTDPEVRRPASEHVARNMAQGRWSLDLTSRYAKLGVESRITPGGGIHATKLHRDRLPRTGAAYVGRTMKKLAVAPFALAPAGGVQVPTRPGGTGDGAAIATEVAPLRLDGVTGAAYTTSVDNGSSETVWTRDDLTSERRGDSAGSSSHVGPWRHGRPGRHAPPDRHAPRHRAAAWRPEALLEHAHRARRRRPRLRLHLDDREDRLGPPLRRVGHPPTPATPSSDCGANHKELKTVRK